MTAAAVEPAIQYSAAEVCAIVGGHLPTKEQAAIIAAPLEPGIIIAGAGSGKTETIATRVVWLVANGLVDPAKILGLTFTRKAAGELNQRIASRLRRFQAHLPKGYARDGGNHGSPDYGSASRAPAAGDPDAIPTVSTYAAFAAALVDEHGLRLGAEPGARLLTGAARWQLAWDVVTRFAGPLHPDIGTPRTVTAHVLALADEMAIHLLDGQDVQHFSTQLIDAIVALDAPGGFAEPIRQVLQRSADRVALLDLVDLFQRRKSERHLRDFADQMRLATELAALPAVQASERAKYHVVLLDEYQDTSYSETALLESLFGGGRPVTAVGDPLQAIYGWRGASASNITGFAHRFRRSDHSPAPEHSLMTSWRNDRAILTAANRIAGSARIGMASARAGAQLGARPDAEAGSVQISFLDTTVTEAAWIADCLQAEWLGRSDWTNGVRTAAVLVRKRAHIPAVVAALEARGLPVEVLSLGGLLSLPEVIDVLSTLRVLVDVRAGGALSRLLTGARWRVGVADVVALSARAATLARAEQPRTELGDPIGRPELHLIDALDSLGTPSAYSAEGYRRMTALGAELAALRRRSDQPLPDLIEDIVRTSGLGIELAVRGGGGRANLDRLVDEAAAFTAESAGSIPSFLAYLEAARTEERGLDTAEVFVQAECIQVLTVHGAKGLEWDVVAVPGLSNGSFPAEPRGESWTKQRSKVPFPLRGDADALPHWDFSAATKPAEVNKAHTAFITAVNEHRLIEERRLAYVAMTRPRKALYCSGAAWSAGTKTVKTPSPYLLELHELADPVRNVGTVNPAISCDAWYVPQSDEINPLTAAVSSQSWPVDPLGGRAASVRAAAALVRAQLRSNESTVSDQTQATDPPSVGLGEAKSAALTQPVSSPEADPQGLDRWRAEVDMLLTERRRRSRSAVIEVELPEELSTSEAVALASDPAGFARTLLRPMPHRPSAAADRGHAFHDWLEQRFGSEALLDLDDLFDSGAEPTVDEQQLSLLRNAFLASDWAHRAPIAVEVAFELPIGPTLLRGRMDAVFADPDGGYTILDWKTGRAPSGRDAQAKAAQLATYRLAWARLRGIGDADLQSVRAAFHYVGENRTVYPEQLLDAEGLRALLSAGGGGG